MMASDKSVLTNSFLQNELNQAAAKMRKLLDLFNTLTLLSFDRGNRNIDFVIRAKVEALSGEIDQYYRTIRSYIGGKPANKHIFNDILVFFGERYLTNNKPAEYLTELKQEIDQQIKLIREEGGGGTGNYSIRRDNGFLDDLARDLIKWEQAFTSKVLPCLNEFLIDINEILLFYRLNDAINLLINSNEIFIQEGEDYVEFKNSISHFVEYHIMLTRIPLPDAKIEDFINQILQRMGFRNLILKSKNISLETYKEIINEIIKDGNFTEFAKQVAPASSAALEAIKRLEEKQ